MPSLDIIITYNDNVPLQIPLVSALVGGKVSLIGIDGRSLDLHLSDVTAPGSIKVLSGEGMPISKLGGQKRGDLHITLQVEFPRHLTDDKKQQLRRALG